jgi:hypothetical protein
MRLQRLDDLCAWLERGFLIEVSYFLLLPTQLSANLGAETVESKGVRRGSFVPQCDTGYVSQDTPPQWEESIIAIPNPRGPQQLLPYGLRAVPRA